MLITTFVHVFADVSGGGLGFPKSDHGAFRAQARRRRSDFGEYVYAYLVLDVEDVRGPWSVSFQSSCNIAWEKGTGKDLERQGPG